MTEATISTSSKKVPFNPKLKKMMEEESRLVKGKFRNYENPGCFHPVHFKKYRTPAEMRDIGESGGVEEFKKWMKDGEVYEIPLFVARFLNGTDACAGSLNGKINSCAYPIHAFKSNGDDSKPYLHDERGIAIAPNLSSTYKQRVGFESLEFGA